MIQCKESTIFEDNPIVFFNKVDMSEFAPKVDESTLSRFLGQIEHYHIDSKYQQALAELLD